VTETDHVQQLARLIDGEKFAMLTTRTPEGTFMSRPMALQEVEFDGDLWFFSGRDTRKTGHVAADPQVSVTVSSADVWVSLSGRATVVDDLAKKRELWNAGIEAWFPDGRDKDSVVLLHVESDSAEYWDTPGGRVTTAISFVKGKLTGKRYTGGEDQKVELS
jgi:general stress protein 26